MSMTKREGRGPRTVDFSHGSHSGVTIEHIKSRRKIVVSGWFDHIAGIEPVEVSLDEFCAALGIPLVGATSDAS